MGVDNTLQYRSSTGIFSAVSAAVLLIILGTGCAELPTEAEDGSITAPIAHILSPSAQQGNGNSENAPPRFRKGEEVLFQGYGLDAGNDTLDGESLNWTSSKDGVIGIGRSFTRSEFSNGAHLIVLSVIDEDGAVGRDSVRMVIQGGGNGPPMEDGLTVEILSRARGLHFFEGEEILLKGTAAYENGEVLNDSSLRWDSDLEGELGTGREVDLTGVLSPGNHKISLTATDSTNRSESDQIRVVITAKRGQADRASDVVILSPGKGNHFFEGEKIVLKGAATDETGDELSGYTLQWSSDLDGEFGTGGELDATNLLSLGNHAVTLTATGDSAVIGSDRIRIVITRNRGRGN